MTKDCQQYGTKFGWEWPPDHTTRVAERCAFKIFRLPVGRVTMGRQCSSADSWQNDMKPVIQTSSFRKPDV